MEPLWDSPAASTRVRPGLTQEVAPNESRSPKPKTGEDSTYEALFVGPRETRAAER
jgi:hypothetical protein